MMGIRENLYSSSSLCVGLNPTRPSGGLSGDLGDVEVVYRRVGLFANILESTSGSLCSQRSSAEAGGRAGEQSSELKARRVYVSGALGLSPCARTAGTSEGLLRRCTRLITSNT